MDELKKILDKFNPFSRLVDFFLKRAKLLEKSLKEKYSTVLRVGLLFASFLLLLGFYSLQRFENDIDIETESQIIIENIEIPETQQFETPPPPARPSVPVESEDDDLADDLTIEETDLDSFDRLPLLLVHKLNLFLMMTRQDLCSQLSRYILILHRKLVLKDRFWYNVLLTKQAELKKQLF